MANKEARCDISPFTVKWSVNTEISLRRLKFWESQKNKKGEIRGEGRGWGRKKELPVLDYISRVWFMSTFWKKERAAGAWLIHLKQGVHCRYSVPFESSITTYKHWRIIIMFHPSFTDDDLFQKCYPMRSCVLQLMTPFVMKSCIIFCRVVGAVAVFWERQCIYVLR